MATDTPALTFVQYRGIAWDRTMSHPCGKARMALSLKGLDDYKLHNCRSPGEVKKFNTRGRVPILIMDGEHFVDSSDIMTELDRRYPDSPMMPADPAAAAQVKILEDWADEVLYFYGVYTRWCVPENYELLKAKVLSKARLPIRLILPIVAQRQVRLRTQGQGVGLKDAATVQREINECLDALDALLAGATFAVGDTLTRADLSLASIMDQFRLAAINPALAAEVEKRGRIMAWLGRVHAIVPSFAG